MSGRLILVFGPSGVGKTTALKFDISPEMGVVIGIMDELAENLARECGIISSGESVIGLWRMWNGGNGFLSIGIEAVSKFQNLNPEKKCVIDVGAGFLDAPCARDWLARNTTILFWAPKEIAYERRKKRCGDQGTLQDYGAREYSPSRLKLYELANHTVDAGCDSEDSLRNRVKRLLCEI